MKLYHHPLSGHSHRVRLFLSLIGAAHELVEIDLLAGEQRSASFLALNPFGQAPVLDDDGVVIADSNAILIYLALKYGKTEWLPINPARAAAVQRWLSMAAGDIAFGPALARKILLFGLRENLDAAVARAHTALQNLEAELATRDWLVGSRPTLADVALYGYVARAPEGNVALTPYEGVRGWLDRIEALPGFVPFMVSPVGLSAPR